MSVDQNAPNSRFQHPPLEEMTLKPYALTINIEGTPTNVKNDHQRYLQLFDNHFKVYSQYKLYPEYGFTGRLHYHGIIQFKTNKHIALWYSRLHHLKDKCTFTIKPIINKEWLTYCQKQRPFMELLFKDISLPYILTSKLDFFIDNPTDLHELDNGDPLFIFPSD